MRKAGRNANFILTEISVKPLAKENQWGFNVRRIRSRSAHAVPLLVPNSPIHPVHLWLKFSSESQSLS